MREKIMRYIAAYSWILWLLVAVSGCASSPNPVFNGPYPDGFVSLSDRNPLLAAELGKLPEFQDGLSSEEASALSHLIAVYARKPLLFDAAFEEMHKVGLPQQRKFCAPLQALFWLALWGEHEIIDGVVNDYSLPILLSETWDSTESRVPVGTFQRIILGTLDPNLKENFVELLEAKNYDYLHSLMIRKYRQRRRVFTSDAKKAIKQSMKDPRWDSYGMVVARLNAPKLVDYYTKQNVRWVDWRTLPSWPVSPYYVFKNGKGDCTAISDFIALCLSRAGYRAYEYRVPPTRSVDSHHSICVVEIGDDKWGIDNGRTNPLGMKRLEYFLRKYGS